MGSDVEEERAAEEQKLAQTEDGILLLYDLVDAHEALGAVVELDCDDGRARGC